MNILMCLFGFILGVIVTAVFLNNQHHKIIGKIVGEIDDFVDSAEDVVKEKWTQAKGKFQ